MFCCLLSILTFMLTTTLLSFPRSHFFCTCTLIPSNKTRGMLWYDLWSYHMCMVLTHKDSIHLHLFICFSIWSCIPLSVIFLYYLLLSIIYIAIYLLSQYISDSLHKACFFILTDSLLFRTCPYHKIILTSGPNNAIYFVLLNNKISGSSCAGWSRMFTKCKFKAFTWIRRSIPVISSRFDLRCNGKDYMLDLL